MTADKRIVLVTGCPRSGTTVLTRLLNCHPDVAIGMERYTRRLLDEKRLNRDLFEADRFATFVEGDCNRISFDAPVTQQASEKAGSAIVIGDKSPNPREVIAAARKLDGALLIVIVREPGAVARSFQVRADQASADAEAALYWQSSRDYRQGVAEFNRGMRAIRRHLYPQWRRLTGRQVPTLVVPYEGLFSGDFHPDRIFEFMGVDPRRAVGVDAIMEEAARHKIKTSVIDQYVSMNAKFDDYRQVMKSAGPVAHGGLQ